MDKDNLIESLQNALHRHAFNGRVEQVIKEIAEDNDIDLTPGKFEVEGYVYRQSFSKANNYGVFTHASQVMLYENPGGGDSMIDLEPYFNRAFGKWQWGGRKVRLTIEEVKD